jgi:OOP family OmpA-OmpF porin
MLFGLGNYQGRTTRHSSTVIAAGLAMVVAGCSTTGAPSTDSTQQPSVSRATADPEKTITVTYPIIAPIRLPDTSILGSGDEVLSGEASSLKDADAEGLDIVSPSCDAQGNLAATAPDLFELTEVADYMNMSGDANVEMTTDPDGTKHYQDLGGSENLELVVRSDGSGTITDLGGSRNLTATINADGSGELTDLGESANLNIVVNPDGSGHLTELSGSANLAIDVEADGSGSLTELGGDNNLSITIPAVGQAELTDLGGNENLHIVVEGDGSGHYENLGGSQNLDLVLGSDGSLEMTDLGSSRDLALRVEPDGSGTYRDWVGDVSFAFGRDGLATDGSGYAIELPEPPVFSAPDRFPPLGKFGRLAPPCATVLRFDADVLFDFGKADLTPQAQALIAQVAGVLAEAGKPIQVEGHTDSISSDAFNDELSLRRADAFATALTEHGVGVAITTAGWGERRPVAPNTTADGQDNPEGRALNRRVEVVVMN